MPKAKKSTPTSVLGHAEGREIVGVSVIVRKTGDGLSESVKVDPDVALDIRIGDEGYIVFAYRCVDVHTPAVDRKNPAEGGVLRVPVLDAGTATFLDDEVVVGAIKRQEEKNRLWRDAQAGQKNIETELLEQAHERGEHADGLVDFCPPCEAEKASVAREKAEDDAAWDAAEGGTAGPGDEVGARRKGRGRS